MTESQDQKTLIRWWSVVCSDFNLPESVLMACPAQASRTPQGWSRIKSEGYRTGTPDLFLAVPRKQPGLFIEMKRATGGVLSESQREMIFTLQSQGYATAVACGFEQAKLAVLEYLKGTHE